MFPSSSEIVVFVHVAVAFVLVGSSLSAPLLRNAIRGAASPGELKQWVGFARRATRLNPAAALVLLASGIWLGAQGWWSTGWFWVSIAAWLANSLLAVLVVNRTEALLDKAADAGWPAAAVDPIRFAPSWDAASGAMLANDLALVWIMLHKPSLAASVALTAAANAILVGIALARRGTVWYGAKVPSEA